VDWDTVQAMPGVHTPLAALRNRYRLAVATNAADSNAAQVRAALARVDLDPFFPQIFTNQDLGQPKPDPLFFHSLAARLVLPPAKILYVGDRFENDILAAHQTGMLTAWYNPARQPAPALYPVQDVEFHHWQDFSSLLARPLLPGYAQCFLWLNLLPQSQGLLAHVQAVAAVAYQLAIWLRQAELPVDPLLAQRAALLHDLAKIQASRASLNHGDMAAEIVTQLGYPVLAGIIQRHLLFAVQSPNPPCSWEEKIVYLADKLIEGSHLVDPTERLNSLSQRYPQDQARIQAVAPHLRRLQDEICQAAGFPAGEMLPRLREAMRRAD